MMTADETQTQIALGFLDSCTDDQTGFLPSKAPLPNLAEPFTALSDACGELSQHYHHKEMDCRPWLDGEFKQVGAEWEKALKEADQVLLESLMTKTSLLCHAFLCQNAYGDGLSKPQPLPPGLEWLWTQVAERLDIPRAGNFYCLVANNWKAAGAEPGSEYKLRVLAGQKVEVLHGWLSPDLELECQDFVSSTLVMEAKGARLVELIRELYGCVLKDNSQEATYHMMMLSAAILSLSSTFNRAYKKRKASPAEFSKLMKPTLVLGEQDGAGALQSCTFQLLESFFGLDPESEFGKVVMDNRRLMMPAHRKLLKVLDQTSPVMRSFVASAGSPRLLEAYNRCLSHMKTWRLLYVKRGALLPDTERKVPIQTQTPTLEGGWAGKEWSLDFLFRFLTDEQRAMMARNTETIRYKAGEAIIQQGNLFPGLFELKSGSASVKKQLGEEEEVVDTMGVNEVFGEMSLVENLPASASIVADVDLEARQVSLETVYDLINEHRDAEGGFYLALGQLISNRLRRAFPPRPATPV